ncbi:glycosyltransferase family protein [Pedobacter namyangjuensis]|uniref:glycosyl transferase family 1 n=1 Tax=Pedobacter namyangjuensis TaxID=600626 RepID=UPI000DE33017|nr:glycosyl transferase family 1 [Pedobacter namyangjuensis]
MSKYDSLNVKNELVFVANFPSTELEKKEGMAQRILAVDQHFKSYRRIYLQISFLQFLKKKTVNVEENCVQLSVNLFFHFFTIIKIFKRSRALYFHSMINVMPSIIPVLLAPKRKIILDIHGVVPEENYFTGRKLMGMIYSLAESIIFKRLTIALCVSQAMIDFYKKKYKNSRTNYVIYTILPANLAFNQNVFVDEPSDVTNIVYSGNAQKWQNVDYMVQLIKQNLSQKIYYYILTGEPDKMKVYFDKYEVPHSNYTLKSVHPDKLYEFYQKAHYGFILRDDVIVNKVACPTKMVEYLQYGIIPIVKTPFIGDFHSLGYEFVCDSDFSSSLLPNKSIKNKLIAEKMKTEYNAIDLKSLLD